MSAVSIGIKMHTERENNYLGEKKQTSVSFLAKESTVNHCISPLYVCVSTGSVDLANVCVPTHKSGVTPHRKLNMSIHLHV